MALCKTNVLKLYNYIIEDVISEIRDIFTDEGIDEQILQELKALWESKLLASNAVNMNPEVSETNNIANKPDAATNHTVFVSKSVNREANFIQDSMKSEIHFVKNAEFQTQQQTNNQVQIVGFQPRVITMPIPTTQVTSSFLQQQINAAIHNQQQQLTDKKTKSVIQRLIPRGTDGATDTSDEDDYTSEDEIYEEKEDYDTELDDDVLKEEPLNSDDDITDEEPTDLFDTENVIVCRCDKITRSRNKWKFFLKDGIMNLYGEDYVFQKASGDADW